MSEQQTASLVCRQCGHRNRPGMIFCEECGTQISTGVVPPTQTRAVSPELLDMVKDLPADALIDTLRVEHEGVSRDRQQPQAEGLFEARMMLRLQVEDLEEAIVLRPFEGQDMIFGRTDPETGFMPHIDLLPYGGYRMGISRRHAALRLANKYLMVRDLGSSNGTLINGVRLAPHESQQIRDGDQLRLGNLVFLVTFEDAL
ncbi:MAG: FHA domain-containing protein [Chloroflexota bacterium]